MNYVLQSNSIYLRRNHRYLDTGHIHAFTGGSLTSSHDLVCIDIFSIQNKREDFSIEIDIFKVCINEFRFTLSVNILFFWFFGDHFFKD